MSIRVPFHLRRRNDTLPASGLLIDSDEPGPLIDACTHLSEPLIFRVAGGYLVIADQVGTGIGGMRLRRLSENCYLPADADLVPAMTSVELVELTQKRGLVFRPNRDPLAFDPNNVLRPSAFLTVRRPKRDDWEPFPKGPPIADRLTSITRLVEIPPIEEMLGGDDSGVGTEEDKPPEAGPGKRALGKASSGLGKGLGALGRALGSKSLSNLGDKLKKAGRRLNPRMMENLLGKQEAALQRLLQRFREGRTEDALRNAVPTGGEQSRGSQIYNSDQLPRNGLTWSLGSLFGRSSGPASIWSGGNPDTWRDLVAEYHKAAREAADRGDFRRAALIYAKLLNDFRAAAETLARGGLHREAGILFRDKVKDTNRAAREFEQAGEFDEALKLYRETLQFEEAGDLLRRMDEEERAIEEYHRAAKQIIDTKSDYVAAGDVLLKKTGRADLAGGYFAKGWESRSSSLAVARNAVPCAERLIELYAFAEPRDPFWQLLGEAETWLNEPGWNHDASRFFNKVCGIGDLPHLKEDRGEIRDRCRLGLASKLRQSAAQEKHIGTMVSDLFSVGNRWESPVISDADFAVRAKMKLRPRSEEPRGSTITLVRLHNGKVTAVAYAPESEDVFVGFDDGTIAVFSPKRSRTMQLSTDDGQINGLSVNENGTRVAVLHVNGMHTHEALPVYPLGIWIRDSGSLSSWIPAARKELAADPGELLGLLPLLNDLDQFGYVGVQTSDGMIWYSQVDLTELFDPGGRPDIGDCYLRLWTINDGEQASFWFEGGTIKWSERQTFVGWTPQLPQEHPLSSPVVSWLVSSPTHIELAGIFESNVLYWTELDRAADRLEHRTLTFRSPDGFLAAACWKTGMAAGVTAKNRVQWLQKRSNRMEEFAPAVTIQTVAKAVACFPSRSTNELLVVLEDGTLARVSTPA